MTNVQFCHSKIQHFNFTFLQDEKFYFCCQMFEKCFLNKGVVHSSLTLVPRSRTACTQIKKTVLPILYIKHFYVRKKWHRVWYIWTISNKFSPQARKRGKVFSFSTKHKHSNNIITQLIITKHFFLCIIINDYCHFYFLFFFVWNLGADKNAPDRIQKDLIAMKKQIQVGIEYI